MKLIPIVLLIFLFTSARAQNAPNISVRTVNGDDVSLQSLTEKGPTLVNFWALWCDPCKAEMRVLQLLFQKYSSSGFSILAINQDSPKSVSKVRSYAASQKFAFHIALDPNGELLQQFNGQQIPFSALYDKNGTLVYKAIGYKPGDEVKLESALKTLFESTGGHK
jgi:thiol-disulfide isomerase/thioredoxin